MNIRKRRHAVYYKSINNTIETNINNFYIGDLVKNKYTNEKLGKINKIMINLYDKNNIQNKYIIYVENTIISFNNISKIIE